jgi:RsmE family RNA methyltransferase
MNLILLHPSDFHDAHLVRLSDHRAQHIRQVLRADVGHVLRIGQINGSLGQGTILSIDSEGVDLRCTFEKTPPPKPRVDLLLAMPRPKVMKRLWAQIATLGVGQIVLLKAAKVERYYFDSHIVTPEFYTPRLIEGLQQARCTHLPQVHIRQRFKPFVEDELDALFPVHKKLLADPSGQNQLSDFNLTANRILLAIGPEGGWIDYELDHLRTHGFKTFGMGPRILRTDTACVGLLTLLMNSI